MAHQKGNNESWGDRILVDVDGDGKQGICFTWPPQTKKLKITCKVLSCVGVGLIKKTLSWQQISCIPCNGNLENLPCISVRWSTSLDVHHILHTGTWLRGEHYGKFCNISCNSVLLQVTNRWKHCHGDNANNHKKLLMPQSYRGYPHKAWGGTLAATDKVSECHRQKWLNSQVFLQISTTRNAWKLLSR